MSTNQDNSTQAPPAPKSPTLCKMGCGFFGNDATGDCCSKCWMDSLKKNEKCVPVSAPSPAAAAPLPTPVEIPPAEEEEEQVTPLEPEPMEVDAPAPKPIKKKKKKKQSYKSMMNSMMAGETGRDVKLEQREKIGKGLGGGAFQKVEKI